MSNDDHGVQTVQKILTERAGGFLTWSYACMSSTNEHADIKERVKKKKKRRGK